MKGVTMNFTLTVPKAWNFTASQLMRKYALNTPGVSMARDQYFNRYIETNGKLYAFDHWSIQDNEDGTETVTVYLKEKA
jgi:hypothetical protein